MKNQINNLQNSEFNNSIGVSNDNAEIKKQYNIIHFKNRTLKQIFKDIYFVIRILRRPIFYLINFLFVCSISFVIYLLYSDINSNHVIDILLFNIIPAFIFFNFYSISGFFINKSKEYKFEDRIYIVPLLDLLMIVIVYYILFN